MERGREEGREGLRATWPPFENRGTFREVRHLPTVPLLDGGGRTRARTPRANASERARAHAHLGQLFLRQLLLLLQPLHHVCADRAAGKGGGEGKCALA